MKNYIIEELFESLYELKNTAERVPILPQNMGRAEMHVLYGIYMLNRQLTLVKVTDISRKLGIQSPNVISLVKKMEKQELVCKRADTKDKRVVHVTLTEKGEQLVERYILAYYQLLEEALDGEEENLVLLLKNLKRLNGKIEKTKALFIERLGGNGYE